MEYLWNNTELPMPPLKTVPVKKIKFDIFQLKKTLQDAVDFFECQLNFNENALLCSKLIMKRKNSFKHFKGFQDMCQAKTSLHRLAKINLPNVLKNFIGLLPESLFFLELPPKVNLDYVLLRIIGYYKVLTRVCDLCKYAVSYFVRILRNNFFMETLSLFLSVLSKIWYDGNIIAKFTSKLYVELKKYIPLMPVSKEKHDFDNFMYPTKLCNEKSDIEHLDKDNINDENRKKSVFIMKDRIQKPIEKASNSFIVGQSSLDMGEAISRDSFLHLNDIDKREELKSENKNQISLTISTEQIKTKKISKHTIQKQKETILNVCGSTNQENIKENSNNKVETKLKVKSNKMSSDINEIKTVYTIKKFFKDESLKRRQSKSVFGKYISDHEWSKFQKVILRKIKRGKEENAVKIFKKYLNKKQNEI